MLPGNRGYLLTGETSEVARAHAPRDDQREGRVRPWKRSRTTTTSWKIEHKDGGTTAYKLGPPDGQFQARVPIYGKLSFTRREGKPEDQGINVGDEWSYRSFIQGRTASMAIWTFSGLRKDMFPEEQFPNGIPVEMTIEVFRTHKGNMEKGVAGTIFLENPKTHKRVTLENFPAEKFATDVHMIPLHFSRAGRDGKIEHYDLFRDLVSEDGQLAISLQCLECGQNFGMAQPDLYIRAADGTFEWNFVKAYVGIWLQMVLVLSLGVMFSTLRQRPGGPAGHALRDRHGAFEQLPRRTGQRQNGRRRAVRVDEAAHDPGQHDLGTGAGTANEHAQGDGPGYGPVDALRVRRAARVQRSVPTAGTWPSVSTWGGTCSRAA